MMVWNPPEPSDRLPEDDDEPRPAPDTDELPF